MRVLGRVLPALALVMGLGLFATSFAWTTIYPPGFGWTEADDAQLREAEDGVVRLYKKLGEARIRGVVPADDPVALTVRTRKTDELRRRRLETIEAPRRTAARLRLIGVSLLVAGVGFHLLTRRLAPASPSAGAPGR